MNFYQPPVLTVDMIASLDREEHIYFCYATPRKTFYKQRIAADF